MADAADAAEATTTTTSSSSTNSTALAWAAAAAARALTAAAHRHAAWKSIRRARECMAEAAAAGRDAMVAGGGAVDHDGRVSKDEPAKAAALLKAAARAQRRTGAAFGEAAAQARSSAAEFEAAADAHAMAGDADSERAFRGRAGKARAMARDADGRAAAAGRDARAARAALRKWKAKTARLPDGDARPGGRAARAGGRAGMRADAEHDRAKWSDAARRAVAGVQAAAEYVRVCTDATEEAAAAAKESRGLAELAAGAAAAAPGARDAAVACMDAVEAARKALEACRPRERRAAGGRPAAQFEPDKVLFQKRGGTIVWGRQAVARQLRLKEQLPVNARIPFRARTRPGAGSEEPRVFGTTKSYRPRRLTSMLLLAGRPAPTCCGYQPPCRLLSSRRQRHWPRSPRRRASTRMPSRPARPCSS